MGLLNWLTDRKEPRRSVLLMCIIGGCLAGVLMVAGTLACRAYRTSFVCAAVEKSPPWALLAGLATLPGIALGWYWRTDFKNHELDSAAEKGRAERFVKYAEMLAHDKGPALLGGIHGLRHLAIEDERRKGLVVDVLCSFIRSWASRDHEAEQHEHEDRNESPSPPSLLVTTAIEALSALKATGADLRAVDLQHLAADEAVITDSNFTDARLAEARLFRADLSQCNFTGTSCYGVNMTEAKLVRASFAHARLGSAMLNRADLTEADMSHSVLSSATLKEATLLRANLSHAELKGADLRGANLEGTNLENANLENANFEGANVARAFVSRRQLSQTRGQTHGEPAFPIGDA